MGQGHFYGPVSDLCLNCGKAMPFFWWMERPCPKPQKTVAELERQAAVDLTVMDAISHSRDLLARENERLREGRVATDRAYASHVDTLQRRVTDLEEGLREAIMRIPRHAELCNRNLPEENHDSDYCNCGRAQTLLRLRALLEPKGGK